MFKKKKKTPVLFSIDVDINRPDEKSVITYVASYYHTFARMKNEMKSGRRIANVINNFFFYKSYMYMRSRFEEEILLFFFLF